jgi:hypothetical protein
VVRTGDTVRVDPKAKKVEIFRGENRLHSPFAESNVEDY